MKTLLFIKNFEYWHPSKMCFAKFERMRRYKVSEPYATQFIEEGYAVECFILNQEKGLFNLKSQKGVTA